MKVFTLGVFVLASVVGLTSCKKTDLRNETNDSQELRYASTPIGGQTGTGAANVAAYVVALESKVQNADGSFTWTWSIRNPNPGNGKNGTVQDLSHWNMPFGSCVDPSTFVSVETSYDGQIWNKASKAVAVDPSQSCVTTPVLKFEVSTSGMAKTYSRITTTADYGVDVTAVGFYKSGRVTGCGQFWFAGMGCSTVIDN